MLQVLRGKLWQFEPRFARVAGPELIEGMVQKKWLIRLPSDPKKLAITAAGKAVLTGSKGFNPAILRLGRPVDGDRSLAKIRRREMPIRLLGGKPEGSLNHSVLCPVCRQMFDVRDLAQAFEHMHGERPELLDSSAPGS